MRISNDLFIMPPLFIWWKDLPQQYVFLIFLSQVRSSCQNLLLHPLVEGLLNYKWKKYCRYTFYGNFLLFTMFLIMFNIYMLTVPPYYKVDWNKVLENRKFLVLSLIIYFNPYDSKYAWLCLLTYTSKSKFYIDIKCMSKRDISLFTF